MPSTISAGSVRERRSPAPLTARGARAARARPRAGTGGDRASATRGLARTRQRSAQCDSRPSAAGAEHVLALRNARVPPSPAGAIHGRELRGRGEATPDPRRVRSSGEIGIDSPAAPARRALDAHLALQLDPVKEQSRRRSPRARPCGSVIREKGSRRHHAFTARSARRRSVRRDRCQGHRRRLGELGSDGFVQPELELT